MYPTEDPNLPTPPYVAPPPPPPCAAPPPPHAPAPPPPGGFGPGAFGQPPPDNGMTMAIIATVISLFCCLLAIPAGVYAVVLASRVEAQWRSGQTALATETAAQARKWAKWTLVAEAVTAVSVVVVYAVMFALAAAGGGGVGAGSY